LTALDVRRLNRALLARQLLLRRRRIAPPVVLELLGGLQAQVPRDPYVALWSRIDRFRPESLSDELAERRAVRMPLHRATLHLVTARDALRLRPVIEPALHRTLHTQSPFGKRLTGLDVDELMRTATELLEEAPRSRAQLAPLLAERWPDHDGPALAYASTYLLPLVQVTPRGEWRRSGPAAFTTLEGWLGRRMGRATDPRPLIVRYLAAFGPATPADFTAWCGLQGAKEHFEHLRPRLRSLRDDRDRELFDVPDGPLPKASTPAPVRFLPEYDNAFIGHADRSRIVAGVGAPWTDVGWGIVLLDGFTSARWKLEKDGVLRIEPFRDISRAERAGARVEAGRLNAFLGGAAVEIA
jgi:Winged helix DNA-binding domain